MKNDVLYLYVLCMAFDVCRISVVKLGGGVGWGRRKRASDGLPISFIGGALFHFIVFFPFLLLSVSWVGCAFIIMDSRDYVSSFLLLLLLLLLLLYVLLSILA